MDDSFELPTPPAIAAKKSAGLVLEWCTRNRDEAKVFAWQLVSTLKVCFSHDKKMKKQKEKMWEQYYVLRSTDEFADNWAAFLLRSGVKPSPTLYQHITNSVFNHLIKEHYTMEHTQDKDTGTPTLDYNEKNALRYVSGYLTRKAHLKLKESTHAFKDELCLCLAEMNDIDPEEMNDDTNEWMKAVDRGGLKYVTNMTYSVFASAEIELRKYLHRHSSEPNCMNVLRAKETIMDSDEVLFYWSMISANWDEKVASVLLDILVDSYLNVRGHSTASAWLEMYKKESKKLVQKSKGVRKQLIATSSASKESA